MTMFSLCISTSKETCSLEPRSPIPELLGMEEFPDGTELPGSNWRPAYLDGIMIHMSSTTLPVIRKESTLELIEEHASGTGPMI